MKKVELTNFSLRGILNAMLMRNGDNLRLKFFGRRVHHGYIGLFILAGGMSLNMLYLNLTGISFLVHDIFSEAVIFFRNRD